jgi:hypothetical protein
LVERCRIAGTQQPLGADEVLRQLLLLGQQRDGGFQAAVGLECLVEAFKAIEISLCLLVRLNPFQRI